MQRLKIVVAIDIAVDDILAQVAECCFELEDTTLHGEVDVQRIIQRGLVDRRDTLHLGRKARGVECLPPSIGIRVGNPGRRSGAP